MDKLNKNIVMSVLLAFVVVLIVYRVVPPSVDPVIEMTVSKNRTPIQNINQQRNIEFTRQVMIDKINLAEKNRFRHPELGDVGFADSFFADIRKDFTVKTGGRYLFKIGSDDGFKASVNGQLLCEFAGDRPYQVQTCPVNLPAGTHTFELSYFQGFGNAGLTVEYQMAADRKTRFFGENSEHVSFD